MKIEKRGDVLKVLDDDGKLRVLVQNVTRVQREDGEMHAVYCSRSDVANVRVWANEIEEEKEAE